MSTKQAAETAEVQREKVTLIAGHKHAGQQYKAGDKIDVTAIEKEWLIRHERIAPPAEQAAATAKVKE